jgi:FkbM family methyltransferase
VSTVAELKDFTALLAAVPPGMKLSAVSMSMMDSLLLANDMPRHGVIHLGGHSGQEVSLYAWLGFRRALLVEPLPDQFDRMAERCAAMSAYMRAEHEFLGERSRPPIEYRCVRCAATDRRGVATLYRTVETQYSSMSQPLMGGNDVRYEAEPTEVETRTLDDIVETLGDGWSAGDFTYLRMNIQGGELAALKGAERVLESLRGIMLEVNVAQRYEGQPVKEDFDAFLDERGFDCTFGFGTDAVGNLFYRRR